MRALLSGKDSRCPTPNLAGWLGAGWAAKWFDYLVLLGQSELAEHRLKGFDGGGGAEGTEGGRLTAQFGRPELGAATEPGQVQQEREKRCCFHSFIHSFIIHRLLQGTIPDMWAK
jgi:hypothetical protein